jgi:hypothetical protein
MLETIASLPNRPPDSVPDDLSEWCGDGGVAQLAMTAATRSKQESQPGWPETDLVPLLAYCYARGRYSSREIELAVLRDATARRLCGNRYPNQNMIRHARRRNRLRLHQALQHLLAAARQLRTAGGGGEDRVVDDPAGPCDRDTPGRELGWGEAGRRIERAIRVDSMALDE